MGSMTILGLSLLTLVLPACAQDSALEARLTSVTGTVYLHLHGQPDGDYIQAQAGASLEEGDVVRTGDDGSAEVTFQGPSVVDLTPNTDFAVKSLAPDDAEFDLGLGTLIAKIQHLLEGRQLRFATPTAIAAVRGTELGVSQDGNDEPARVGVYDEGRVSVSEPGQEAQVQLGPGQETEVYRGRPPQAPRPLRALAVYRARFQALRRRQAYWRAHWRPRSRARLRALRRALLRRPVVKARLLHRVRVEQRRSFRPLEQRRRRWRQLRRTELRQDRRRRPLQRGRRRRRRPQ